MDLIRRMSKLNPEQRRLLELKIKQRDIDIYSIPISQEYRKNYKYFPLTSEQEPMWFIEQYEPNNPHGDVIGAVRFNGNINKQVLEKSINEVVKRHEILRAVFIIARDKPAQMILSSLTLPLKCIDFSDSPQDEQEYRLTEFREDNSQYTFDLSKGPLIKTILLDLGQYRHIFITIMHHTIGDLISLKIFFKEVSWFYQAFFHGKPLVPGLPALSFQYVDYACWQHQWFRESIIGIQSRKLQEAFWLNMFRDEVPVMNLPTDYPRPAVKGFSGSHVYFRLKEEEIRNLKEIVLKENTTLYVLLLSLLYILLAKISGQDDIVVGTLVNTRKNSTLNNMIGLFVKTVALRNYPQGDKTFKNFLIEVNNQILTVYKNQDYQYEELVGKVLVQRTHNRNPLFDVLFNFIYDDISQIEMPGLKVEPYRYQTNRFAGDLELSGEGSYKELILKFSYDIKLFKEETVTRFVFYFKKIIRAVIRDPYVKISEIEIIPGEEKKQVLFDFNDTTANYPKDKTILELVEKQVFKIPDLTAAVCGHHQLSYRVLLDRYNQLAWKLKTKGVAADIIVGLMVERSLEMLIGIMGILKAGGAYLPIDPEYPDERKKYVIEDSETRLVLIQKKFEGQGIKTCEVIKLDEPSSYCTNDKTNFEIVNNTDNLAYTIYTSGSTGKPKGVMINHYSLVNRLNWMQRKYPLDQRDIILHKTPFTFDVSLWEIFWWSMIGARVCFLIPGGEREPQVMINTIQRYGVTIMHFVPSMLKVFLEFVKDSDNAKDIASLKQIIASGEALTASMVELFNDTLNKCNAARLANLYGPTEATVDVSYFDCPHGGAPERVPIGKPIDNIKLYVLDSHLKVQPVGMVGELCISGDGLARGYLNNPELTAAKFDHDLWDYQDYHDRDRYHRSYRSYMSYILYKTGDFARWLPDGNIEFLGRIDHQVKIRGFRIELGEIENQLLTHPDIRDVVVVVNTHQGGDKFLCAYAVVDNELSISQLREFLSGKLPDYMIPGYFVPIERIPLTPNGKLDRKMLPEPETGIKTDTYVPPQNAIEEKLVRIWSEVLGIEKDKIGTNANFFAIGGHSLRATVMLAKIHKELNVELGLTQVFKSATIRGLSSYIEELLPSKYVSLKPTEKREYYPLSSAQRRLYVLKDIDEQGISYNLPSILILKGDIKKSIFEETFLSLIRRHESLRTSFHTIGEAPVQRIHDEVEFEIEYYDLYRNQVEVKVKVEVEEEEGTGGLAPLSIEPGPGDRQPETSYIKTFIRPFDLYKAPLLRVGLTSPAAPAADKRESPGSRCLLMVDMHHIISDGVSGGILIKDLMSLYGGKELPLLYIQYKDFSQWQHSPGVVESIKNREKYWLKEFEGEIPVLSLPTDFSRPVMQEFVGSVLYFEIGKEDTAALREYALEEGTTLFTVLLAIYYLFLYKISSQEDIVVGTPIASRRHSDLENIVGMFVNTLAIRSFPIEEKDWKQFLEETKSRTLAAFENQDYPYEELVEKVAVTRDPARNPLFDVMFVLQNIQTPGIDIPGLKLKPYHYHQGISQFDLTGQCVEIGDTLRFSIEFSTKLFKTDTIQRFIKYFKKIVSIVIKNPGIKISNIEIISQEEKRYILFNLNRTEAPYPKEKTIIDLFGEQVGKTPDHIAVVGKEEGVKDRRRMHLTYRELNKKSNRLAHLLIEEGVQPDTIVGIIAEPSIEMVNGLLSIWKAGGAYLPIDPEYPEERIKYMLKDSNLGVLVTTPKLQVKVKAEVEENFKQPRQLSLKFINIETEVAPVFDLPLSILTSTSTSTCQVSPTNLAYVIYTSGTTGKAKGVMVDHRNIVNYIHAFLRICSITSTDAVLQQASFTFDASIEEIFPVLLKGGKIVIPTKHVILDIDLLMEFTAKNNITIIDCSPLLLNELNNARQQRGKLDSVHTYISGGDVLKREYIENIFKEANVLNGYGPTETTICVTYYMCGGDEPSNIPLGKPIANYRIYILGKGNQLQPNGVSGEICAAGDGVSRGYLNRPHLTAEKYGLSPFNPGERLYRTGDLGRWQRDGNIQFLGRVDQQVKIRGFRIEPGEIECQLLKHKIIKEVVVVEKEGEEGIKYLCAYIAADMELTVSQLREFLSVMLPGYMIPSYFVFLKKLPLTPNGKIDCRALPVPGVEKSRQYIPPGNAIERKLTKLWSGVLNLQTDVISINQNFFELGGHSLKAISLTARMHKEFNVKVSLTEIFKAPTIQALAQYIREAETNRYRPLEPVEKKEYYLLSSAQMRMYITHQRDVESIVYNMPLMAPLTMEMLGTEVEKEKLDDTIRCLIDRHESFRTSFEMINGQPVQRIHHPGDMAFEIEYRHLREKNMAKGGLVPEEISRDFIRPFHLARAPLLRVALVEVENKENKEYILMVDMHHIISDFTSDDILFHEFMARYRGEELPLMRIQYKDFSEWQNREEIKNSIKSQQEYWLNELQGEIPLLNLPLDYPRSSKTQFRGSRVSWVINSALTSRLIACAAEFEVTLMIFLFSVYNILLAKYTGQEEIVVGTAVSGRRHSDLENIIGFFVNILAIKTRPAKNRIFREYLLDLKEKAVNSYENQEYPFEELISQMKLPREPGRHPLVETLFTFQEETRQTGARDREVGDAPLNAFQVSHFDILLYSTKHQDSISMFFEYSTDLFKPTTIEELSHFYMDILTQVIENPEIRLKEIEISLGLLPSTSDVIRKDKDDWGI